VRLTFENFDPRGKGLFSAFQAYEAARKFAEGPDGWLVLVGPSGCGKTHLAAAIANYRIGQGEPALFIVVADLLDHLRSTYSPESEVSYDEFFPQVRAAPLLILDDIGIHPASPWAREKLFQLINHRYNSRLPTVFTLRPPLERLEEAWRTRLTDPQISRVCFIERSLLQVPGLEEQFKLELYRHMTFERWDRRVNLPPGVRQNLAQAYEHALKFARNPEGWLVFLGETGCGKTHLAAAIANYRIKQGQPVLFTSVRELLDHFRSSFAAESPVSFDRLFDSVKKAPLLILDDFGDHPSTSWAWQKLYQLIDYRHAARLPTVITSRLSLEELEALGEEHRDLPLLPIASRISDCRLSLVFAIKAPDYRIDHPPRQARHYS